MKISIKHIVFYLMFFLLGISVFVQPFDFVKVKKLKGYFPPPEQAKLDLPNWIGGQYQTVKEEKIKYNLKLRHLLTRVYNQFHFTLFDKVSIERVVVGKKGYLYEQAYIDACLGLDFRGDSFLNDKVRKLKLVSDTLGSKGTKMYFVFASGKGTVYPEFIPAFYDTFTIGKTNREILIPLLQKAKIPVIDINDYFLQLKDTIQYPLYPQRGIHWSSYGTLLALDTMIKHMEYQFEWDMMNFEFTEFRKSKTPKNFDHDIGDAMNLLFYRYNEELLYPFYKSDTANKKRPNTTIIGDSYWWTFSNIGIPKNLFESHKFWYYLTDVHSKNPSDPKKVDDYQNLVLEVEKQDLILFMITDANLRAFTWGFADRLYDAYFK